MFSNVADIVQAVQDVTVQFSSMAAAGPSCSNSSMGDAFEYERSRESVEQLKW